MMNNTKITQVTLVDAKNLFFIFSLILVVDYGLWFQRTIFLTAGHDSWLSILFAYPISVFTAWIIYKTVQYYPNSDLYRINRDIFGKWLGAFLNTLFALYILLFSGSMLRNIEEVVITLLFPDLPSWLFMSIICALIIYGIFGGIRVIIGFIMIYFIAGQLIYGLQVYTIKVAQWDQLLPFMEASPKQLLDGTLLMMKYNLGLIQLYFLYPFIRDKNRVNRYMQYSILYSVVFSLCTLIIAIAFFGGEQLKHTTWPNLTAFKIVTLPVLERFDFLVVAYLVISVFSASLLMIWSSTRGLREAWKLKQKYALYFSCLVLILLSEVIQFRYEAESFSKSIRTIGVCFEYVYPLFLYLCVRFKRTLPKQLKGEES